MSGSLTPAEWDGALVSILVLLGLPVFFLPHLGREPLGEANPPGLSAFADFFSGSPPLPVVPATHLPATDWVRHYERILRGRLHRLPGGYEFSVLRAVRELEGVCLRIARFAAVPDTPPEETVAVFRDLHAMALRGIVIGVAALAYHALGFETGCPHNEFLPLLRHIREKEAITRRDLLRKVPAYSAADRDKVLERLAAEGRVELDGRTVAAVPLADFVRGLHTRPEFPEPKYHWPELPKPPDQADNTKS